MRTGSDLRKPRAKRSFTGKGEERAETMELQWKSERHAPEYLTYSTSTHVGVDAWWVLGAWQVQYGVKLQ